jgi:hypothetical protein
MQRDTTIECRNCVHYVRFILNGPTGACRGGRAACNNFRPYRSNAITVRDINTGEMIRLVT